MSRSPKVLVVDDGDSYVELFHALMRDYTYATRCELSGPCWTCPHQEGCVLTHAHDWAETEQALARHDDLDLVLLDMTFELPAARLLPSDAPLKERRRSEGLRILDRIRAVRRDLPVVLMTSEKDVELDQRGALGADEYLTFAGESAFDVRALSLLIERIVASRGDRVADDGYVWGRSAAMGRLRRSASALARTSLPVLLLGETGTGKSALARRVLHGGGHASRNGPFVAVDLAAIPENLMAAELFGSATGAFSGAVNRPGRFEEAHGGTLFLDEVGNLPPAAQRMLLLALQDGRITRLGETKERQVDVKLVAATNADLSDLVRGGAFRADLLARLNPAAALRIPALRERTEDLERLMQTFARQRFAQGSDQALLAEYQRLVGIPGAPCASLVFGQAPEQPPAGVVFSIPASTLKRLRQHDWPGNVRELELLVGNALLMTLADAMAAAEAGRPGTDASRLPVSGRLVADLLRNSWLGDETAELGAEQISLPMPQGPRAHLRDTARELERALMRRLFAELDGDLRAMARRLLIGDEDENVRRLRTRLQQLGLSIRQMRFDAASITDDAESIILPESERN